VRSPAYRRRNLINLLKLTGLKSASARSFQQLLHDELHVQPVNFAVAIQVEAGTPIAAHGQTRLVRRAHICLVRHAVTIDVRVAQIPETIPIQVGLIGVVYGRTVVAGIDHAILIGIKLALVGDAVVVAISTDSAGNVTLVWDAVDLQHDPLLAVFNCKRRERSAFRVRRK
jgi:hypothetical protein